jgi:glutamate synthase domain-containing protein 2
MIELKLSQGAKPGHGGVLPGPKVTPEIAAARGVPVGVDCVSPARTARSPRRGDAAVHRAAARAVRRQADRLQAVHRPPLGVVRHLQGDAGDRHVPDFIVVDGAEGGTGAAPLEFTDHVGAPLQEGLLLVHNTLVGLNLRDRIRIGCAGKVVSAFDIARADGAGRRLVQRGARLHVRAGLHPGQTCHTGAARPA